MGMLCRANCDHDAETTEWDYTRVKGSAAHERASFPESPVVYRKNPCYSNSTEQNVCTVVNSMKALVALITLDPKRERDAR